MAAISTAACSPKMVPCWLDSDGCRLRLREWPPWSEFFTMALFLSSWNFWLAAVSHHSIRPFMGARPASAEFDSQYWNFGANIIRLPYLPLIFRWGDWSCCVLPLVDSFCGSVAVLLQFFCGSIVCLRYPISTVGYSPDWFCLMLFDFSFFNFVWFCWEFAGFYDGSKRMMCIFLHLFLTWWVEIEPKNVPLQPSWVFWVLWNGID